MELAMAREDKMTDLANTEISALSPITGSVQAAQGGANS